MGFLLRPIKAKRGASWAGGSAASQRGPGAEEMGRKMVFSKPCSFVLVSQICSVDKHIFGLRLYVFEGDLPSVI